MKERRPAWLAELLAEPAPREPKPERPLVHLCTRCGRHTVNLAIHWVVCPAPRPRIHV